LDPGKTTTPNFIVMHFFIASNIDIKWNRAKQKKRLRKASFLFETENSVSL
jgi:hypothetical protein